MAKSRFEYVKNFELADVMLPHTFMVVRVDGRGFTRFCDVHGLIKPNDVRLLSLMNSAARHVMAEFKDAMLAYGQSDEYSFIFRKSAQIYNRRASKILSTVVSLFSTAFVYNWPKYFHSSKRNGALVPPEEVDQYHIDASDQDQLRQLWPSDQREDIHLAYPPSFDSRLVIYPTQKEMRDYLSWRQADCHINNLYNTCFWKLVLESHMSPREANATLGKTDSAAKNEMLFSQFSTNYNSLPALCRKGTTILRMPSAKYIAKNSLQRPGEEAEIEKDALKEFLGVDMISQTFWDTYPFLVDDSY